MKDIKNIKKRLLTLCTCAAEKNTTTPLLWEGTKIQQWEKFPIVTLLAIPWKVWPKGSGAPILKNFLLGEGYSYWEDINIPIIKKGKILSGAQQILMASNGELENHQEENQVFTWKTQPKETFLITPEKNKILPPRTKNGIPRLVGTWEEFSEYFEANREGGWLNLSSKEKTQAKREEYVPPLALHIDLCLLEEKNPNFEEAGLPTGETLSNFIKAISSLRNKMLSIILHGKKEAVNAYQKELEKATESFTHRHNVRWLNPTNIKLKNSILIAKDKPNADPDNLKKIEKNLPEWEETLKHLPEAQEKAIEAFILDEKAERSKTALKKYATLHDIKKAFESLNTDSLPSIEDLVKEKENWENQRKESDYIYSSSQFQKEDLLQALRDPNKKEKLLQCVEVLKKIKKAKSQQFRDWRQTVFSNPILLLQGASAFRDTWKEKTKGWRTTGTSVYPQNLSELEKNILEEIKNLDPEVLLDYAHNTFDKNTSENEELWEKKVRDHFQEKIKQVAQETKEIVSHAKRNITGEDTTLRALYLYGEISQRNPHPSTTKFAEISPNPKTGIQKEDWITIEKALGENHTPLLTYIIPGKHVSSPNQMALRIPNKAAPYIEPSTLPTIPKSLQEPSLLTNLENTLQGKSQTEKKKISLNIRLVPQTDPITNLYLDLDNLQISIFNPVIGKPTGLKETLLWRPILTKQGIAWAQNALEEFNYQLEAEDSVHNYAAKKVRQAEKALSPNYALTQYEKLAYYQNGETTAQATILNPDTGKPLWIAGKNYQITPSWDREQILVDNFSEEENLSPQEPSNCDINPDLTILGHNKTNIEGAENIERLNQVSINFGFSTFLVKGEDGKTHKIKETLNKENSDIEKERIATEIQTALERLEEINENYALTPREAQNDIQKRKANGEENPKRKSIITPSIKREKISLETKIKELEEDLDRWMPSIDDFIEAFPPESPPLSTQIYEEKLREISKKIIHRFAPFMRSDLDPQTSLGKDASPQCTIKNYQLRGASLMALKRSCGNSGHPGSGKTITSIMASWYMGHHYNLIIAPTIALNTWAKELEKVGLYHEIIGYRKGKDEVWRPSKTAYQDIRSIRARHHSRIRKYNRLGKIEPEYYIISAETLSLGGEGNLRFNPWHADYPITKKLEEALKEKELPKHWEIIEKPIKRYKVPAFSQVKTITSEDGEDIHWGKHLRVWSDRIDNSHELEKAEMKGHIKTTSFHRITKSCPSCHAQGYNWSNKGHCRSCGHNHSAITRQPVEWGTTASKKSLEKINKSGFKTTEKLPKEPWKGTKTSNAQYPGYKLLGKHFGLKIIDEIHNFSSFSSQHGNALLQVKTKDTIILSGTLCKTHITELEPSLCHIYEPNSGEFPYTPWGMELFKEQFSTFEIRNTTEIRTHREGRRTKRKKTTSRIPEASNLTKLRSLMHGVIVGVSEKEMAKEWNLRPIHEKIHYVELANQNFEIYQEWERKIQEAYQACQTSSEKSSVLQKSRKILTSLAYACDGPEKLQAAISWIQEGIAQGKRNVVVGPSTRFYTLLNQELKNLGIPFTSVGSMPPEKRFETLNKFRDSGCPVLTSRIRLINVNFNQLTCCQRILFTGIDPSPSAIRQMQMRLNRIGQTEDVECGFLITQLPPRPPRDLLAPNGENLADLEGQIRETLQVENPQTQQDARQPSTPERRHPSYEERLFATVLRREKAIQAVLNQTDKQRDPQELYDMIQDRQTLNEVLKDIATEATMDENLILELKKYSTEKPPEPKRETPPKWEEVPQNLPPQENPPPKMETIKLSKREITQLAFNF